MGVWKNILFTGLICCAVISLVDMMMVMELDDTFPDRRKETAWLVMFYAPWCGHCKKLEPTFYQVGMDLDDTEIRVGKLDATQYQGVASLYGITGYPTIKFLRGETIFTHKSDRSRNSIVEFAKRAFGPQIRYLSNQGRLYDTRSTHSDGVFFLYIGDDDPHHDLMVKYTNLAEKYAVQSYFYAGTPHILPININLKATPTILVYKDNHHFEMPQDESEAVSTEHLENFFIQEQFTLFPKIEGGGGLNEYTQLPKKLVVIVVEEYERNETKKYQQDRAKSILEYLAKQHRETYYPDYHFAWMSDLETARTLTMSHMEAPHLFVLNPSNHYYYLPEFNTVDMTQSDLVEFLTDIKEEKVPAYGGTGIIQGVKRFFYDIFMTVYELYRTAGWLTFVIFGVPALVISIVCYAMCCMEPFDDSIFEREYWEEQERLAQQLEKERKEAEAGNSGAIKEEGDEEEKKKLLEDSTEPCEQKDEDDGHMKKD